MAMKWKNLKDGLCPSCGQGLQEAPGKMIVCGRCSFKINEARLNEIIRFGYQPRSMTIGEEEQRLAELNNLGRQPFNPYSL